MRVLVLMGCVAGLAACTEEKKGGSETAEGQEDTAGGGGEQENWRASGTGVAYFTDGESDGSLFRLSLSRALPPRTGYAYYGFVSGADGDLIALGEIAVNGEDVVPQPGGFYGGWINSWIAGPFKGVPGSMGW